MKEKYLINARIVDPKNDLDETGGLIIDSKGHIKAVGKKVTNGNLPSKAEKIDLKTNSLFLKFVSSTSAAAKSVFAPIILRPGINVFFIPSVKSFFSCIIS